MQMNLVNKRTISQVIHDYGSPACSVTTWFGQRLHTEGSTLRPAGRSLGHSVAQTDFTPPKSVTSWLCGPNRWRAGATAHNQDPPTQKKK